MEYGRILKRAWSLVWRYKILWILGIAAVIFSGNGGIPNLQYRLSASDFQGWQNLPWGFPGLQNRFIPRLPDSGALAIIALIAILFGLVLAVVSVIVRYTSIGGMIHIVNEVEETADTSLRSGVRKGWSQLLRLFVIDLLIGVGTLIVTIALIIVFLIGLAIVIVPAVLIFQTGEAWAALGIIWIIGTGLVWLLLLVAVAIVMSFAVTLLREFAFRFSVLEGRDIFKSIGDAYTFTRKNLRQVGLMWLILLGINLALSIIATPLIILVSVLFGVIVAVTMNAGMNQSLALLIFGVPLLLLVIAVAALVGGVYTAFVSSIWTLTFRELRQPQAPAQAQIEAPAVE
ncbi:MAG: hypothetical protein GX552_06955 [Chloroflexi bacterium]|nr:hypothetical protein [Chloroflexota bacterium]